jgi:hypothetical protein
MIEAYLYVRDDDMSDETLGRLIMHRSYKDSEIQKVLKYMEQYISEEKLNHEKEIMIRVKICDDLKREELDLRDFK